MSGNEAPRRTRLSPDERAEVVLRAAANVFAERGYDRASMREIASVAGVTTPVLYDHFQSKGELYRAAIEMQANSLVSQWVTSAAPPNAIELFNSTTAAFFEAVSRSELTWRLLFADRPSEADAAQAQNEVQQYATEAIVASLHQLPGVATPIGGERGYYALAEAIKGAGHSLIAWWQNNKDVSIEQIVALNRLLVWDGLSSMVVEETPPDGPAGAPRKGEKT